jgi:hypothetical protein
MGQMSCATAPNATAAAKTLRMRHSGQCRVHLRIEVRHYRPIGVAGDLYQMTPSGPVLRGSAPLIRFGDPLISWVLAKQLLVEIDRYRLARPEQVSVSQAAAKVAHHSV